MRRRSQLLAASLVACSLVILVSAPGCGGDSLPLYGDDAGSGVDGGIVNNPPTDFAMGNCGNGGQPCCANGTCGQGFTCRNGSCASCGHLGEGCCPGGMCSAPGSVCNNNVCAQCGGPGQACCTGGACNGGGCCVGNACIGANTSCGMNLGNCTNGKCDSCGGPGQPCCRGSCMGVGTVCAMNMCVPCGAPGQACCANSACTNGCCNNFACVAVGAMCGRNNSGTCQMNGECVIPCGDPGQACCDATTCKNNGCCIASLAMGGLVTMCVGDGMDCGGMQMLGMCTKGSCGGGTCGNAGQPCCGMQVGVCTGPKVGCDNPFGMNRMCVPCGGAGQPCCNGRCDSGNCNNFQNRCP